MVDPIESGSLVDSSVVRDSQSLRMEIVHPMLSQSLV